MHRPTLVLGLAGLFLACGPSELNLAPGESEDGSAALASDVEAALRALPMARVLAADRRGVPTFVVGDLGPASEDRLLERLAPLFRLQGRTLRPKGRVEDAAGSTFRFVDEDLAELVVRVSPRGRVTAAMGNARGAWSPPPSSPALSPALARRLAVEATSAERARASELELVSVRPGDFEPRLAYRVRVQGLGQGEPLDDDVFLDASTGAVVRHHARIQSATRRLLYDAAHDHEYPGTLARPEQAPATGDESLDVAYEHLGLVDRCHRELFGRSSFDGQGSTLIATVHYGQKLANAFWTGSQLVFGDGDEENFADQARSLDVMGHELAHGVTQSTAGLIYSAESGALNESMSDVLGVSCRLWSKGWALDEASFHYASDGVLPGAPTAAVRFLDDPTADGPLLRTIIDHPDLYSRDYYPERFLGWLDNGGVHLNSGISNLAFHLAAVGGRHPRGKTDVEVPALGVERAARIFFHALTGYLSASSDFRAARLATRRAAFELEGEEAAAAIEKAWEAVGVGPSSGGSTPLFRGDPVELSALAGVEQRFHFAVPPRAGEVSLELLPGQGELAVHVKEGTAPTEADRSLVLASEAGPRKTHLTSKTPDKATVWHLLVKAPAGHEGHRLLAHFVPFSQRTPLLELGKPLKIPYRREQYLRIDVPENVATLKVRMSGGGGNADLLIGYGERSLEFSRSLPKSEGPTNEEELVVPEPSPGLWLLRVTGPAGFWGAQLEATVE